MAQDRESRAGRRKRSKDRSCFARILARLNSEDVDVVQRAVATMGNGEMDFVTWAVVYTAERVVGGCFEVRSVNQGHT
jgi:uncharacterized protein (DUF1778 family)